ncbi:MAG: hypothetical protein ACHP8A_10220 [Terriglobales bacterium]
MLKPDDYVKVEFVKENTGESEWMWVEVSSDDSRTAHCVRPARQRARLKRRYTLGQERAVSYDNIREHRTLRPSSPA